MNAEPRRFTPPRTRCRYCDLPVRWSLRYERWTLDDKGPDSPVATTCSATGLDHQVGGS